MRTTFVFLMLLCGCESRTLTTNVVVKPATGPSFVIDFNTNKFTSMGSSYSDPQIADGTQWVLWIGQAPLERAIYFNNAFPEQIMSFAARLDAILAKNGSANATWKVTGPEGRERQKALWNRLER